MQESYSPTRLPQKLPLLVCYGVLVFPCAVPVDCRASFAPTEMRVPLLTLYLGPIDSVNPLRRLPFADFVSRFLRCHSPAPPSLSRRASVLNIQRARRKRYRKKWRSTSRR